MIKKQYLIELSTETPYIKKGQKSFDVKKVQEWINLWKRYDPDNWKVSVAMDGDFGRGTEEAIKEFQTTYGLGTDGIVGNISWRKLIEPMTNAFSRIQDNSLNMKELIVAYAKQHIASSPREFNQNEGTWVRSYMDGHEGKEWAWCMGFSQTIADQATATLGDEFTNYMPATFSCDVIGNHGLQNGKLIENAALNESVIEPGDFFLIVKVPKSDWTHVGIVTGVNGDWIETIEGNTNDEGSREGYEVCARKRNFKTKNIDLFKLI
ncbi:MAG: peptidoglycan-binding protein [Reichenbachiella sp.]